MPGKPRHHHLPYVKHHYFYNFSVVNAMFNINATFNTCFWPEMQPIEIVSSPTIIRRSFTSLPNHEKDHLEHPNCSSYIYYTYTFHVVKKLHLLSQNYKKLQKIKPKYRLLVWHPCIAPRCIWQGVVQFYQKRATALL